MCTFVYHLKTNLADIDRNKGIVGGIPRDWSSEEYQTTLYFILKASKKWCFIGKELPQEHVLCVFKVLWINLL